MRFWLWSGCRFKTWLFGNGYWGADADSGAIFCAVVFSAMVSTWTGAATGTISGLVAQANINRVEISSAAGKARLNIFDMHFTSARLVY